MGFIAHPISFKRCKKCLFDLLIGRHLLKSHSMSRVLQALQVLIERKNPPVIDAQPLPHSISALYQAVKNGDLGIFPIKKPISYPYFYFFVFRIEVGLMSAHNALSFWMII